MLLKYMKLTSFYHFVSKHVVIITLVLKEWTKMKKNKMVLLGSS